VAEDETSSEKRRWNVYEYSHEDFNTKSSGSSDSSAEQPDLFVEESDGQDEVALYRVMRSVRARPTQMGYGLVPLEMLGSIKASMLSERGYITDKASSARGSVWDD